MSVAATAICLCIAGLSLADGVRASAKQIDDSPVQSLVILAVNPWTVAMNVQYDFVAWGRSRYARADDQFASRQTAPTSAEDPGNETYDPELPKMLHSILTPY